MKCLSIVIHQTAREGLADQLVHDHHVLHWQATEISGRYAVEAMNPFETASDRVSGNVPHVRFDILLEESHVAPVVERLRMCRTCVKGTGYWWVTDVRQFGEL